jgi:hypothetical protein
MTEEALAALRIAVTDAPWPHNDQSRYVAVVAILPEGNLWVPGLPPTEAEAAMIASFIAYKLSAHLYPHQVTAMRAERLFDTWHASPYVLCNRGKDGWMYNRPTWRTGPLFAPYEKPEPLTLAGLLDLIEHDSDRWATWKAERPEVFPS